MNLIRQETRPTTSYRLIPLTQGQFAIVDAEDFEWLNQWKWYARWAPHTRSFYAIRNNTTADGKRHTVYMHRLILGLTENDPRESDHENGNTLDNRRHKLRVATTEQNVRNARMRRHNKSGLKGVSRSRTQAIRWIARIQVNKKQRHLGSYATKEEAHRTYAEAARLLHGEFAHLG